MGHANIYIRKENEGHWDKLPDKSAWVNERLEQSFNHNLSTRKELVVKKPRSPKKILSEPQFKHYLKSKKK